MGKNIPLNGDNEHGSDQYNSILNQPVFNSLNGDNLPTGWVEVVGQELAELGAVFKPGADGAVAILRHLSEGVTALSGIEPDTIKKRLQRLPADQRQEITEFVGGGSHAVSVPAGGGRRRSSSEVPFRLSERAVEAFRAAGCTVVPINTTPAASKRGRGRPANRRAAE